MTPSGETAAWIRPRDLRPFVGGRILAYFAAGIVAGLALFAVELGFAYVLQVFLLLLGIATGVTLHLPDWLRQQSVPAVLVAVVVLSLVRSALLWTQMFLRDAAGERFACRQRAHILRWAFYSQGVSSSRVTSLFGERATQAGMWVRQVFTGLNLATICALLVGALFYLQPYVTLAVLGVVLALMAPVRRMNTTIRRSGEGVVAEWDATYRTLVLSVKNLLLLRIYGLEQVEEQRTTASLRSHLAHYLSFHRTSGLFIVMPQTVGVTVICLLLAVARARIQLTAGVLLVYFYLLVRLLQNSAPLGQAFANALFQWPQVATLYGWWRTDYLATGAPVPRQVAVRAFETPPTGAVGWRGERVGFAYPGTAEPVIRELSFDIAPGSAVVITGPSGAGKSTLLNLLLAELTPRDGRIDLVVDGGRASLADCKPQFLPMVGYVGTESFLIDATIRENLLYGVQRAPSDDDVADALRKAECGFIDDLPLGLEHRLTDQGAGLSSGQKQRLSLARALLRRPRVLVLDEATANLDVATEEKLVDTLAQLKGGMTIVAATHRQALLRLADQVLTLPA